MACCKNEVYNQKVIYFVFLFLILLKKFGISSDRIATLSPIPSSSSLSTLRQAGVKLRRHSESSRRTPSERSTVSPAGSSSSSRLTYQDRRGYETIRSIRRPFPIDELTDLLTLSLNTKSIVIKARHLQQ